MFYYSVFFKFVKGKSKKRKTFVVHVRLYKFLLYCGMFSLFKSEEKNENTGAMKKEKKHLDKKSKVL